jgi:hypothetical protein
MLVIVIGGAHCGAGRTGRDGIDNSYSTPFFRGWWRGGLSENAGGRDEEYDEEEEIGKAFLRRKHGGEPDQIEIVL